MNDVKQKKKLAPEKFFHAAAKVWIEVYGELLPADQDTGAPADPGFWTNGPDKKNLKLILIDLRLRAEKKNIEWTEDAMRERLRAFLLKSWEDDFISKNFMLRIISMNRTKIFNNQITPKKNGGPNYSTRTKQAPVATIKPKGGFGHL